MPRIHSSGPASILSWPLAVALVAAAQWGGAADAPGQLAEPAAMRFELPTQPLALSLAAFGGITGYSVLVPSNITTGKQGAAVSGEFSPDEALARLLAGTQLAARHVGARAVTLVPVVPDAAAQDAGAAGGATLPAQSAYVPVIQASITRQLCQRQPKIFGRYRVGVQLWLDTAGAVRRVHLLGSSGTPARDAAVAAHLGSLVMDAPPPPGLAQPLAVMLMPRADPQADCRAFNAAGRD